MNQRPYSERFLVGNSITLVGEEKSSSHPAVVPQGFRWVVSHLDAREQSGTAGVALAMLNAAGGQMVGRVTDSTDASRWLHWDGRQVFMPGETLTIVVYSGTWSFQAGGYSLLN